MVNCAFYQSSTIVNLNKDGKKRINRLKILILHFQSVTLHTDLGDLKIELFCEDTPKASEVLHCKLNYLRHEEGQILQISL